MKTTVEEDVRTFPPLHRCDEVVEVFEVGAFLADELRPRQTVHNDEQIVDGLQFPNLCGFVIAIRAGEQNRESRTSGQHIEQTLREDTVNWEEIRDRRRTQTV